MGRQITVGEVCRGGAGKGMEELLLTPCKKKKIKCDDEEELQLLKQIESIFLLKEPHSSPEC